MARARHFIMGSHDGAHGSAGPLSRGVRSIEMKAAFIFLLLAFALASQSNACTWEGLSPENAERLLPLRLAHADAVVIGSVSSVKIGESEQQAQIRVSRSFKGQSTSLLVTSSNLICGYSFKEGEEKVFFIHNGRVNIASVEPAAPWLIAALESELESANAPNKVLQRTPSEQSASEH
jgi:hypothetical protein